MMRQYDLDRIRGELIQPVMRKEDKGRVAILVREDFATGPIKKPKGK